MTLIATFLLVQFAFSLISKRAERTIVTGPMVFTLLGILVFFVLPGVAAPEISSPVLLYVGEITLAVVLFSDAIRLAPREVIREAVLPGRLLGIGMPLTILAGTFAAALLVKNDSIWHLAILATILAPTDPSLGASILKSRLVPHRIREALEIESGINDGLSMPFLVLFIALSGTQLHGGGQYPWLTYTLQQIGLGALFGLVIGSVGGWLMTRCQRRGWMAGEAGQLALLSLAVLSWWLSGQWLNGNGFIAAFVAGLAARYTYEEAHLQMSRFSPAWRDLLVGFVFFAFGMIAAPLLGLIPGVIWLYAVLSLTVVRMVPVWISMLGTKLELPSVLFMGWFGPRGVASVVLGMIYLKKVTDIHANPTIVQAMTATVLLSVFAHGISANPLIKLYARQVGVSVQGQDTLAGVSE